MKFTTSVLTVLPTVLAVAHGGVADLAKEDGNFWNRYLQQSMSMTPPPTPAPTPAPTPGCDVSLTLNCTTVDSGIPCTEIPDIEESVCTCPDCVRELVFTYTGEGCSGSEMECTDFVDAPHPESATITITDEADSSVSLFEGTVSIGETVTIENADCLPATLVATVASGADLTQTVVIDSSCGVGGAGLVLTANYGAFKSVGYSCSETETFNCFDEVVYGIEACNTGGADEELYEFYLDLDGAIFDFTDGVPESDLMLPPGECYSAFQERFIDRCADIEYCAKAVANMTNPETGIPFPCDQEEEVKFSFRQPPTPEPTPPPTPGTPAPTPSTPEPTPEPTPAPTPAPTPTPATPEPTPSPTAGPTPSPTPGTPAPTPAPSPAPTSTCIIDVGIEGCFNFTTPFDNNCQGRPTIVTFRYNGGDCSQSDNLQDRQKFDCFDVEPPEGSGPPPTGAGIEAYILATTLQGEDVYFEGFVEIGKTFTLNEGLEYDKLSADMNITVYDPMGSEDPGEIVNQANMMQTMFLHLSCSQPLFLLDRFGAQQVVEWVEDDGRVVSTQVATTSGDLELSLNTTGVDGEEGIRLLETNIISNTEGFINKTDEVNGVIISPGDVLPLAPIDITLDLSQRTRYTFFTTVVGETLDGSTECNGFDFHECIVGQALPPAFPTLAPTPSPTVTPYPTPDPLTTECVAEAEIRCIVTDPFLSDCEDLQAPSDLRCSDGAELTELVFEFTGNKCDGTELCEDLSEDPIPDEVYIEITDCETTGFYQASANQGDRITVNSRGNFLCPTIEISIQTLDFNLTAEANEGEELQTLVLPTSCLSAAEDVDGITLNEDYGALKLIRYTSDLDGVQTEFATVQMNYVVVNPGAFGASIASAQLSSGFSGDQDLVTSPTVVGARTELQLFTETVTVNLLESAETTFGFSLSIEGESTSEGAQVCASDEIYEFTV
eukprot:CAMPEP_0178741446 /NCGR_PEP_ID=MMETSP0744-20121128/5143_1 /TAXON_ID=913974 /ORGANISM="Nitzschia punctata, Strain CCMP561" /LENGTH=947 /DNA_ID=CAMNT_0020394317 /DNA_START=119 /DNA_END=2962 /DNA_ORIENTATION=-